jgi:hypothetical protein
LIFPIVLYEIKKIIVIYIHLKLVLISTGVMIFCKYIPKTLMIFNSLKTPRETKLYQKTVGIRQIKMYWCNKNINHWSRNEEYV